MTDIERLTAAGEALYGRTWQAQVSDLLRVDSRRLRAWVQGERSIPPGIWSDLGAELRRRGTAAIDLAGQIAWRSMQPYNRDDPSDD